MVDFDSTYNLETPLQGVMPQTSMQKPGDPSGDLWSTLPLLNNAATSAAQKQDASYLQPQLGEQPVYQNLTVSSTLNNDAMPLEPLSFQPLYAKSSAEFEQGGGFDALSSVRGDAFSSQNNFNFNNNSASGLKDQYSSKIAFASSTTTELSSHPTTSNTTQVSCWVELWLSDAFNYQ